MVGNLDVDSKVDRDAVAVVAEDKVLVEWVALWLPDQPVIASARVANKK